jgi:hypothetical protein
MILTTAAILHNHSEEQYRNFHETAERFSEDPLTLEEMQDPITIECGHVFDRRSFQQVINTANLHQLLVACPTCQTQVNPNVIVPSLSMRQAVPIIGKLQEEIKFLKEKNEKTQEEANKCCFVRNLESIYSCAGRSMVRMGMQALALKECLEESLGDGMTWGGKV